MFNRGDIAYLTIGGFPAYIFYFVVITAALSFSTIFVLGARWPKALWKSVLVASFYILSRKSISLFTNSSTITLGGGLIICILVFLLFFKPEPRQLPRLTWIYLLGQISAMILGRTVAFWIYGAGVAFFLN
jgi:hypothetical protein